MRYVDDMFLQFTFFINETMLQRCGKLLEAKNAIRVVWEDFLQDFKKIFTSVQLTLKVEDPSVFIGFTLVDHESSRLTLVQCLPQTADCRYQHSWSASPWEKEN